MKVKQVQSSFLWVHLLAVLCQLFRGIVLGVRVRLICKAVLDVLQARCICLVT